MFINSLLGVERGSGGPRGQESSARGLPLYLFSVNFYGPKGQENLAQGLPWVLGLSREALKGRTLTSRLGTTSLNPGAPSGLIT
jgi:hypothetical protein